MSKKKSFLDEEMNPAMAFISTGSGKESSEEAKEPQQEAAQEKARGPAPLQAKEMDLLPGKETKMESKTKRVMLLVKPSVYESVREAAQGRGLSFNGYVNQLLEKALELEKAKKA